MIRPKIKPSLPFWWGVLIYGNHSSHAVLYHCIIVRTVTLTIVSLTRFSFNLVLQLWIFYRTAETFFFSVGSQKRWCYCFGFYCF